MPRKGYGLFIMPKQTGTQILRNVTSVDYADSRSSISPSLIAFSSIAFETEREKIFHRTLRVGVEYAACDAAFPPTEKAYIEADYLNLLIQAADTVMELIHHGHQILPQNEMQCRSLRKAAQKAGCEVHVAWQWVLDKIPPHKITHKTITDNILGAEPADPPTLMKVVLPIALVETILRRALEAEMGFTEFLEEMFQPVKNADNLIEKLKQSRLEDDLENLTNSA